ncbi:DUF5133 domain-containing protein [Streptomyces africanus]|uniref:DUF5133 domain-containing protein n=1 Tax=Streptomyces africanus TaxID=231024 RepID=UPI000A3A1845
MLLPAKAEVARQLRRYRAWERVMLAAPNDRTVRTTFEDSGYTLCVLMGKRCAREAADAAERYLRTNQVASVQEQNQVASAPEPQTACAHEPQVTYAREPQAAYAQDPQVTCLQEQAERPRPATAVRRRPPAAERRSPAGR